MKKKPVNGMKDILPREMEIRRYVTSVIEETYESFGFSRIETPVMEDISNLKGSDGGENEKLIFQILKRGEKLDLAGAQSESDLVDAGLRYDLTVPLSRFYANHMNELPSPFKAIQMGPVFRADRPQRGRYRQFVQCDIDILGEETYLAEIELVLATSAAISRLGFRDYTIRISDRRLLKAMAREAGLSEDDEDKAFIILDKMDKIGLDGVREELGEAGLAPETVERFLRFFSMEGEPEARLAALEEMLGEPEAKTAAGELFTIMKTVEETGDGSFRMLFDPTLVRGMGYYTGPIFEIAMDELGASVGGGGRYDHMIERFLGQQVAACGFSIGFERIVLILLEQGFMPPHSPEKTAILIGRDPDPEKVMAAMERARKIRKDGGIATVCREKKNKRFQKEQLTSQGYTSIEEIE